MPVTEVANITPELAEKWLTGNVRNRNIRRHVVEAYARDMTDGHWVFNGESIKFAEDGTLLDGQHRLLAVTLSGAAIQSLVVYGLPSSAQDTVDVGVARLFSDRLTLAGETNTSTLAALLRRIVLWEAGLYTSKSRLRLTHAELSGVLEREPRARTSAQAGQRLGMASGLHPSVMAFCHWLFAPFDEGQAEWFLQRFADGSGLEAGHPVLILRERVSRERQAAYGRPPETPYLVALTIRAWNLYRAGDTVTRLQLPPGGLTNGNYPMPR